MSGKNLDAFDFVYFLADGEHENIKFPVSSLDKVIASLMKLAANEN